MSVSSVFINAEDGGPWRHGGKEFSGAKVVLAARFVLAAPAAFPYNRPP